MAHQCQLCQQEGLLCLSAQCPEHGADTRRQASTPGDMEGAVGENIRRLIGSMSRRCREVIQASQWCDVVSSSCPHTPLSSPVLSLPPIPPSRFQDARALALELGGGALLELWAQTLERYQRTLALFKSSILQSERSTEPRTLTPHVLDASSGPVKPPTGLMEAQEDGELCGVGTRAEGGLQSWGSLASVFRPQNCSTLKIGEDKKKDGIVGSVTGGKFLQNLLNPNKKNPTETLPPPKPPRKRHPSFDLQALLAPRRGGTATVKSAEAATSANPRASPLSWIGRKGAAESVLTAGIATAVPGWKNEKMGSGGEVGEDRGDSGERRGGGGVLIRGVEVSSKEVVDQTGCSRKHVLLGRTERETGAERAGPSVQSKLYVQWCRLLSSERQYVAVLRAVKEQYLPLLDTSDTPSALRGKGEQIFSIWSGITNFHSQVLLPAIEGALTQTLQQTDCFSKYKEEFMMYSHYIHMKPEPDLPLIMQTAEFFKMKLSGSPASSVTSFPHCLSAPVQRLQQYIEMMAELGGLSSTLSIIKYAMQHGDDLRASDLITGCPVPVAERGEVIRHGELYQCAGGRKKKSGIRNVFLFQRYIIVTKHKTSSTGHRVYCYKHCMKVGEMGLTQSVGDEGLRFEVWVRQNTRIKDSLTLQASCSEERENWTHDIAQLLWSHAIHNTELCLKESLCMGVSSKLLLDITGTQTSELESLNSDKNKGNQQEETGSSAVIQETESNSSQSSSIHNSSPSTSI